MGSTIKSNECSIDFRFRESNARSIGSMGKGNEKAKKSKEKFARPNAWVSSVRLDVTVSRARVHPVDADLSRI
jgi:hypothetical protein